MKETSKMGRSTVKASTYSAMDAPFMKDNGKTMRNMGKGNSVSLTESLTRASGIKVSVLVLGSMAMRMGITTTGTGPEMSRPGEGSCYTRIRRNTRENGQMV